MTWFQALMETYDCCQTISENSDEKLVPLGFTPQNAHIDVTLDEDGAFLKATVINPRESTIIPATTDSMNRASGRRAHPLCDTLQYCAGDLTEYLRNEESCFELYFEQLKSWIDFDPNQPRLKILLRYLQKKTLVADLIRSGVLILDATHSLANDTSKDVNKSSVMSVLPATKGFCDQHKALVRWSILIPGIKESRLWLASDIVASWRKYFEATEGSEGLCVATGGKSKLARLHQAKLRHGGDKAKIISANDKDGFTFRGRFIDEDGGDCCGVSLSASHKCHSALRWLIARQGYHIDTQVIVAWAKSGVEIPAPVLSTAEIFDINEEFIIDEVNFQGDLGQTYALALNKCIAGYSSKLSDDTFIYVISLDSASPGRMSITYYREIANSEFLSRLTKWHQEFAWPAIRFRESPKRGEKKVTISVLAPSPAAIAVAAYGKRMDAGLKRATINRVLPCILDCAPFPPDLVRSVYNRAVRPTSFDGFLAWDETLSTACAIYRGSSSREISSERKEHTMTLERGRKTRDYLYGRLLAFAEQVEDRALYLAGEKGRETMALKLFQRFSDRPFSTWLNIEKSLIPYWTRLRNLNPGTAAIWKMEIDEIHALFESDGYRDDRRLSGEFLLGYHCQRYELRSKKDLTTREME